MLSFFLRLYQIDLSNTQSIKNQNWYGVFFCINWFFFPFPFLSQIFFFSSISFLELATISNSNLLRTFSWLGSIGFNLKIKIKYIELVYFSEIFFILNLCIIIDSFRPEKYRSRFYSPSSIMSINFRSKFVCTHLPQKTNEIIFCFLPWVSKKGEIKKTNTYLYHVKKEYPKVPSATTPWTLTLKYHLINLTKCLHFFDSTHFRG